MRPRAQRDPHVVLAIAALVVLAAEAAYVHRASDAWLLVEIAAASLALVHAWTTQDRLRLAPLLALVVAFNLAYVAVHLGFDLRSDFDSRVLYKRYGERLLDGHYPHAEYPAGAVLLFAFETWISGGATRVANAFTMVPFAALQVAGAWLLRTPHARWLAAVLGLFPLNPYFWEFKFDLVPAALLVGGIVLAQRGRWGLAGMVFGLGAAVKWTPALAVLILAVWLFCSRERRAALRHAIAFGATFAAIHVPFLIWDANAVSAAYSRQSGRVITAESFWYLPLHVLGLARVGTHISFGAHAPGWANTLATLVQLALVLLLVALAARARTARAALTLAALAPAVFLLANRVYSPQFVLVLAAAWAVAGALVSGDRRSQLAVGVAVGVASTANAFVYPYALPHYRTTWQLASLALFVTAFALTAWLVASAARGDVVLRAERHAREPALDGR